MNAPESAGGTGLERIAGAFGCAKAAGRGALIPYLCAGDPDRATTAALLSILGAAGADVIELGVPYGDPLADGPTIAAAAQRALAGGTTIDLALALVAEARGRDVPPVLMFTYFNPVLQYGVERFARALLGAGACGAVVPDVPLEEAGVLQRAFEPFGLALPLLVAPTTPFERGQVIARASSGFTYVVSRLGVTGARREPDFEWVAGRIESLRRVSDRPIAIGFGISTAAHVREACALADGAIVGSALVDAYAGTRGAQAAERVKAFMNDLRPA